MICHAPGTAQQHVCTLPLGSILTLSVCANTTPLVPMVVKAVPSLTTPVPIAAAALSPAPPTTTVSVESPSCAATSLVSLPVTSQDSYILPRSDLSMLSLSSTSSDQHLFATSMSCIPEASETSVANSPVRTYLM